MSAPMVGWRAGRRIEVFPVDHASGVEACEPWRTRTGAMNVFIVDLINQPGQLAKVSEAIARKGINITGISAVTCGGSGAVALLTNDEPGTRKAFEEADIRARELELVTTSIENKPGTLAEATGKLAKAGINIEAAMPVGMAGDKVSLAFATDQPAKAREILGSPERAGIGVG
jgi:hypothetical protein